MKVSRFNLRILLDELTALENLVPDLRESIDKWSTLQDDRERYGSIDQEWVAIQRSGMEKHLTQFREKMGTIYDFMGDRGLAEFIPTRIRNEMAEAERLRQQDEHDRLVREPLERQVQELKDTVAMQLVEIEILKSQ